jgi:hypothetical protein
MQRQQRRTTQPPNSTPNHNNINIPAIPITPRPRITHSIITHPIITHPIITVKVSSHAPWALHHQLRHHRS